MHLAHREAADDLLDAAAQLGARPSAEPRSERSTPRSGGGGKVHLRRCLRGGYLGSMSVRSRARAVGGLMGVGLLHFGRARRRGVVSGQERRDRVCARGWAWRMDDSRCRSAQRPDTAAHPRCPALRPKWIYVERLRAVVLRVGPPRRIRALGQLRPWHAERHLRDSQRRQRTPADLASNLGRGVPRLSRPLTRWQAARLQCQRRTDVHTSFRRPDRKRELSLSVPRYELPDQPAWSSTGRLALTLGLYTGHIGTATAGGKDLWLVTRSIRDAIPDWSPTGDRIVFQRAKDVGRTVKADVLTARVRGKRQRRPMRLTATRDAYFPVWSPDGRYIAYVRAPGIPSTRARCGPCAPPTAEDSDASQRVSWPTGSAGSHARAANPRAPIGTQPRDPPAARPVPR